MHNKILIVFLLIGVFFIDGRSADNKSLRSPFWVNRLEIEPGGRLMLRPRLPYIEELADQGYRLVLDLPDTLEPSPLKVERLDANRLEPLHIKMVKNIADGKSRKELYCEYDFSLGEDGVSFELRDIKNGLLQHPCPPVFKLFGTFDWTTFRKEIQFPDDVTGARAMLIKWRYVPIRSGTLWVRKVKITESGSGKSVFEFKPSSPIVMKLGKDQNTIYSGTDVYNFENTMPVLPGKKYVVELEAKADKINSSSSSADIFKKKGVYSSILIFDIASGISLPDKLVWRIEDKEGRVCEKGEVALLTAKERCAPLTINTSAWTVETDLPLESESVQKLYIDLFYRWGLNMIEPLMPFPCYNAPLGDEALKMPLAENAKKLGMRVWGRIDFMYWRKYAATYLDAHPQFTAIDPQGNKKTNYWPICQAHCLEKDNPWMKYYMDAIEKSVAFNKLDGVFFDYEMPSAPFMNVKNKWTENAPRQWYSPCMCERCRKAFQTSIGLDHLPSVEECCSDDFFRKWTEFRCRQNLEFWILTKNAMKKGNSDAVFALYSAQDNGEFSKQRYGVIWPMAAPYLDFAMQRYGLNFSLQTSSNFEKEVDSGISGTERLPKMFFQLSVFPYPDDWIFSSYDFNSKAYAELVNLKNCIVRTIALARSYGWSFNGLWGADDQLTIPIKEANAILAKYEDYFVKGKRNDNIAVLKTGIAETGTWQLKEKNATFIFNNSDKAQDIVLKLKDDEKSFSIGAHDCYVHEW